MSEYYPSLKEVLEHLGEDGILVGSATWKPHTECKDFDFVVSPEGLAKLQKYNYWLYEEEPGWLQYIPLDPKQKCVDFFSRICDIVEPAKWGNRITFEQATQQQLKIVNISDVEVLSI